MIRRRNLAPLWLAAVAGLAACDSGTGSEAGNLYGLWGAVEYEYTSDADPGTTEDLINDLGATYSLTLSSNGTYVWQLERPGSTQTGGGTFQIQGDQLTLTPTTGTPSVYRFSFNEIFLTLYDDDTSYDFGAGSVPADLRILLDRF